jgi:hypothetical protein
LLLGKLIRPLPRPAIVTSLPSGRNHPGQPASLMHKSRRQASAHILSTTQARLRRARMDQPNERPAEYPGGDHRNLE